MKKLLCMVAAFGLFIASGASADSPATTSGTRLTIAGAGSVTLTLNTNRAAFGVGQRIRIALTSAPTNFMEGTVTAYTQATGVATVSRDLSQGSAANAAPWTVVCAGVRGTAGVAGATGPQGPQGIQGPAGPQGPAGTGGSGLNIRQVATLRWYQMNTTFPPIPVGRGPMSVLFDGANVWTANYDGNDLSKVNASTGEVVNLHVGSGSLSAPRAMAFDGTNIWVVNLGSNSVTKINAATCAVVGNYSVGAEPIEAAFDGTYIWVSCWASNSVYKLLPGTGAVVATYSVTNAYALAFDGTYMWVTASNTNGYVNKLNASTGAIVATYSISDQPNDLVFDGTHMWVAGSSGKVCKLLASSGQLVSTTPVDANTIFLAFDGSCIWVVTGSSSQKLIKLSAATGAVVGSYTNSAGGFGAVAFDGTTIWMGNVAANALNRF